MSLQKSVTRQRVSTSNLLQYADQNRNDDVFNDVTIVTGNENIPGNRLVLSCFSTFFEKMFKSNMKEKYEHNVKIQEFDGKAIKSLIDYIYMGSIDIDNENVIKLLQGADFLQLHDVKQFCFEFLESIISPDNLLETLKLADLYRNDGLKDRLQQYMSKNFDDIAQTNRFLELSISDLMDCISKVDRNLTKEASIYKAVISWTKQDKETRIREFPDLFKLVNINKVSCEFLETVVLEENFVIDNITCYKLTVTAFRKLVKNENIKAKCSKIVSLGGSNTGLKVSKVYNLLSEENETMYPNLPDNVDCHCCLKSFDVVYCIGGRYNGETISNKVWRMDLKNQTLKWNEVASMNETRHVMGAAAHHDTLVVAGGGADETGQLASSEYYFAVTNKWKPIAPMSQNRSGNALVSCDGHIYAVGGCADGKCLFSVERLSDLEGTWEESQPMQKTRRWLAAVNCDNVIYAIGGTCGDDESTTTKTVEKYDPIDNKWQYVSDMNTERSSHAACVMHGKIYVVGGRNAKDEDVKTIECYDPSLDSWNIVGETTDELYHHSIVAL